MSTTRSPFGRVGLIHLNLPGLISQLDQAMGLVDGSTTASSWVPRVDIRETKEAFVIHADIPGVAPEALDIHMDKGELVIKGERTVVSKEENTLGVRVERQSGKFQRRFVLPDNIDGQGIEASCEHGVLEVRVPKKPEEKPRRVPVNVRSSAITAPSPSSDETAGD